MRRLIGTAAFGLLALGVAAAAPAGAGVAPTAAEAEQAPAAALPPVVTSDNLDYIGYLPIDAPAVSGGLREVDDQRLFYVWGNKGLSIYNVDEPEQPQLVGHVTVPASQGENVQISADGSRVIVAADGSVPPMPATAGLHIIDASDPSDPQWVAWYTDGANHSAECADDACEWVYGRNGDIYHVPLDLTDEGDIETVGNWREDGLVDGGDDVTGAHALNRTTHADGTEIMITDTTPRVIMDVTDPTNPVELTRGERMDHVVMSAQLQHNNVRPDPDLWEPRDPEDPGPAYTEAPGLQDIPGELRPGELMISGSETNLRVRCGDTPGKITTWSIANFDRGETPRPIDTLRPQSSATFEGGDPPANVLGCSVHWFDWMHDPAENAPEGRYLLAAAWFEHGVRVVSIDHIDYSLEVEAWAQTHYGSVGDAFWIPEAEGGEQGVEYIYATDYTRGVHILRYHPGTFEE